MSGAGNEANGGKSAYRGIVEAESGGDCRQFATAVARNTEPILGVLRDAVAGEGRALEIASGTGQHVVAFAAAFPAIHWQPSDPNAEARASIVAWVAEAGRANILPPLDIDVTRSGWTAEAGGPYGLIVCINMIHIAPWAACLGLMEGAGLLLEPGGLLYLYGPYQRDGIHTAPSNEAFDRSLKLRHPEWGVRDMAKVEAVAASHGLVLEKTVSMPVNNFSLLFRRAGADST